MNDRKYIGAKVPQDQIDAMDAWRAAHADPRLTRSDALEHFVAVGLGMQPPSFVGRPRPVTQADKDERAEYYAQLHAELGSYAAVAKEVGFGVETVKKVINRYERQNRSR
jgi:hypothetical protein